VNFEVGAERYLINQDRMLKPLEPISPTAYKIINYYKPSVEPQVGPAPNWNIGKVKSEVLQYAEATLGVNKLLATAANPLGAVTAAAGAAVGTATNAAVGAVGAATNAAVGAATNAAVGAATNAAVGAAKNAAGTAKNLKKTGGRRRTLRNRK
jgi:hypothetical protein